MNSKRLAGQIFLLRSERGWSLDEMARVSGISRATLSRIEKADVSPTVDNLHKICAAFGVPTAQVIQNAEDSFANVIEYDAQSEIKDPDSGMTQRSVSPSTAELKAQVVENHLRPDTRVTIASSSTQGHEHHLVMLDGALAVTLDAETHHLTAGDCLRYHQKGDTVLETSASRGARFLLVSL